MKPYSINNISKIITYDKGLELSLYEKLIKNYIVNHIFASHMQATRNER